MKMHWVIHHRRITDPKPRALSVTDPKRIRFAVRRKELQMRYRIPCVYYSEPAVVKEGIMTMELGLWTELCRFHRRDDMQHRVV